MSEMQKAKGAMETMNLQARKIGKRLCLIGAMMVGLAVAANGAEPAKITNVKVLRDGKAATIRFDYEGTLRYREYQFPRAQYGYIDFEPAILKESRVSIKPKGTLITHMTARVLRSNRQRVRLLYQLERWVTPSVHDNGKQFEIRFIPAPERPVPLDMAIPPFDPTGGESSAEKPAGNSGSTAASAGSGTGAGDPDFAEYLKMSNSGSPAPAAPDPPKPSLVSAASKTAKTPKPSSKEAQGGEGSPLGGKSVKLDILEGESHAFIPAAKPGTEKEKITGGRGYEFVDLSQTIFQKPVSLTFKDADLQNAVRILARHAGLNIVMSPADVKGRLTVELNNVPVGAALASILRTNNLELIREAGGIYRVVPSRLVRREHVVQQMTVHVQLNWVPAADVKKILDPIIDGDISADTLGNSLIITDTPIKIEEIANVIEKIDRPEKQVMLEARLVEMNVNLSRALGINWDLTRLDRDISYEALHLPKEVQQVIDQVPNIPTVVGYDPVSGAPIVHTPPPTDIVQNIKNFQTNPLSRAPANIQAALGGQGADTLGVYGPLAALPGGASWAFGRKVSIFGQEFQLSALLEAAEQANLAKVLAAPRVVTVNNQPATINILRRIPYSSTVVGAGGAQSITYDYEDVGIEMTITPNITNNDYVRMKIEPRQKIFVSQVGTGRPTIDERYSQTNVIVKDEGTAVIAGLRQQEFNKTANGVPWMREIPIIGWAFKSKDYRNLKTDLIAFVTPHIVKEEHMITPEEQDRYNEIDVQWDLPDYFFDDVKYDLSK